MVKFIHQQLLLQTTCITERKISNTETNTESGGDEATLGEMFSLASMRNAISKAMANAASELENIILTLISE